ncbi:hypothetical protein BAE44_0020332 [Dichanthelium oligosanthes]|uniref:MATH domain-containing protein n=1 Tax=Dichanthelium oligosanthes TaxID=888268 RepID=A0A1E5V0H7_9POAL|nr:hypothetical protein BAE44_0020332 [Dichanthelium oligosanthes]
MYPLGDKYSTNSFSLYLQQLDLNVLPDPKSGMTVELTVSILDQTEAWATLHRRFVFAAGNIPVWGWPNFIPQTHPELLLCWERLVIQLLNGRFMAFHLYFRGELFQPILLLFSPVDISASYSFNVKKIHSKKMRLIRLVKLLKSSDCLVDDSCVFGVRILKADVSSPEKKPVQNLFLQKEFVTGTYTWTMNNYLELELPVKSPAFEVGGHKWYASFIVPVQFIHTIICIQSLISVCNHPST